MEIVFHLGAHCTDDGQLQRCLNRNRKLLLEDGILVTNPWKFRPAFRETISLLKGTAASPEVQDILLESILDADNPDRLIFSNEHFLSGPAHVLSGGSLYAEADQKCARLATLFQGHQIEFCLAIRNPATFLPAVFHKMASGNFDAFLNQADLFELRWSQLITDIRDRLPNAVLKVWCNEDTPFIWPEILYEVTDCNRTQPLAGLDDYLKTIMIEEGVERMAAYLAQHPPANENQRRRVLGAFLDKFEAPDPALDVEGAAWTDATVDRLTDIYEEDVFKIERMAGITFLSP